MGSFFYFVKINITKNIKMEKLDVYKLLGGGGLNPYFYYNPVFRQFADSINKLFECLTIDKNGHIVILDNKGKFVLDVNELLQNRDNMNPKGNTDKTGIQGTCGVQGIIGLQGTCGAQGTRGVGLQGLRGIQGTKGVQGVRSLQGTLGRQGTKGVQGTCGIQGISGAMGIGIQGTKGDSVDISEIKNNIINDNDFLTILYTIFKNMDNN